MRIPSLLWTFCSAIVIASLVSGCSGNTSTGSNRGKEPARLNGYVGASDAYSVLIYAVPIDSQGQPTTELVESTEVYVGPRSTSTTRAFYQVNVPAAQLNRPATFIALSNSRNDSSQRCQRPSGCSFGGDSIAYNASRQLDAEDFEWRASVGTVLRDMRVNINWITHAASAFAYTSFIDTTEDTEDTEDNVADVPKAGIYTPFTIERANLWLSRLFDISDVISLRPLSPAELNITPDLSSSLRSQGLYYGALLAAAQELASTEDITPEQWLAELVKQLLNTQGQLVMNDEDSPYSLISIFNAAHTILDANRDYLAARNATIPPEVETVLARLQTRVTGYRNGTIPLVEVKDAEVNASLAPLANAKDFMEDLNDRLFNLTGNHPRTCGKEGVDSENCVPSFVDYQYVQTVDAYYQALEDDYRPLLPLLNQGLHDARDLVEGFLACVNGSVACDLPTGWNFDSTNNSATNGSLTLTYKGIALEEAKEGETPTFNAFDVFLNGKLVTENTLNESATLHFKPLADEDDEAADPTLARVRVVFDEATELPPLVCREVTPTSVPSGCVEPLGFDVAWPQLVIDEFDLGEAVTGPESSLRFSFNTTLIGVRDVVIDSSGAEPIVSGFTPYHYNLSAVSLTALLEGEQTGQIREDAKDKTVRNQSELLFSGRASNAANYYGQQRWPSVDDFFRVRDGFDTSDAAPVIAPGLFRYRYFEDVEVLFGLKKGDNDEPTKIMRTADYLEIEILGVGIERIELFRTPDDKGDLGYRKCSIVEVDDEDNPGQTKRQPNLCSDVTAVTEDDFTLSQLIADDGKLGLFAYPSRGAYKPLFSGVLTPTSTDIVIDGELKATFSMGIDRLQLRMAHELFDFADESENDSKTKRLPMALMSIDLSRTSRERWEVALLAGYDYDYVIEGFPIGIRAQSLYASYFVDMNVPFREDDGSGNVVTNVAGFEAGSLIVNRGGVTLFSDTSQSIGITIATLADYLPGDVAPGCAVMGRDKNITNGTCDARGYLTYRGSLLAVIREERPNVFVIRYIDGAFQVIAPPPQ